MLRAVGLPEALAGAAHTSAHDDLVRASHRLGVEPVGPHVGTPTVATGSGTPSAWFGPVLSRVPVGEEAGRLWDGVVLISGTGGSHGLEGRPHEPPRG
ncbi:hypothetical protein GCM10027261_01820 [Geodermatophilus arenarius]|uniref:Uncharacterized protein n=1 Tax=Geodermatophilus arenarius TaxID=1137990 RepID=A0ABV9LEZ7_9ACTN